MSNVPSLVGYQLRPSKEAIVVVNPGVYDHMPTMHRCGVHEGGRCKGCKSWPVEGNPHLLSQDDIGFDLAAALWRDELARELAGQGRTYYFCELCMSEKA
jgi:hypothetical protein